MRAAALVTLATSLPDDALEPAIRMLEDRSPRVRQAAAEATVRVGSTAVAPLLSALRRADAREALARLEVVDQLDEIRAFSVDRAAAASRDGAQVRV